MTKGGKSRSARAGASGRAAVNLESLSERQVLEVGGQAVGYVLTSIEEFQATPLGWQPENEITAGLYRVKVRARTRWARVDFTAVLKIVVEPSGGDRAPSSWNHWRREHHVYQSGVLERLPRGLRAPRFFGATPLGRGQQGLWLEHVAGMRPALGSTARYLRLAHLLAQMNARLAASLDPSSRRWLAAAWLKGLLAAITRAIDLAQLSSGRLWQPPALRAVLPRDWAAMVERFFSSSSRYLQALDRLPPGICHYDVSEPNLVRARGAPEGLVLLDWASLGKGAFGVEVGQTLAESGLYLHVPPARLARLLDTMIDSYWEGLKSGGTRRPGVREDDVRAAFGVSLAARTFSLIALHASWMRSPQGKAFWAVKMGMPFEKALALWGANASLLLEHARRAKSVV